MVDSFARSQERRVEYFNVKPEGETEVSKAIELLSAEGYRIAPDRLQLLKQFGISTRQSGRLWFISDEALRDLRFVLDVERAFGLERDHDGLAFELAFVGYPNVPMERAHRSVQKRTLRILNAVNRTMHRISGTPGTTFHPRRIPSFAAQLAKLVIPNSRTVEHPGYILVQGLLAKAFATLLRVAYRGEKFSEWEVRSLLMDTGLPEVDSIKLSTQLTPLLNETRSWLRVDENNELHLAVEGDAPYEDVADAITWAWTLSPLVFRLQTVFGNNLNLAVGHYPTLSIPAGSQAKLAFVGHSLLYAAACNIRKDPVAKDAFERFRIGNAPEIQIALVSFEIAIAVLCKFIEVKYGQEQ